MVVPLVGMMAAFALAADRDEVGTPASVTRSPLRPPAEGWSVRSGRLPMLCDQMGMVASGSYDAAQGNGLSGMMIWGDVLDLQVVDDCTLGATYSITEVCGGFLTFTGAAPATGLWVQVYDGAGAPSSTALYDHVVLPPNITATPFNDAVFGLVGVVLCGSMLPGDLAVDPGVRWFDVQPVDTTSNGDWYYLVRDLQSLSGTDSFGKDGAVEHGTAFGGPHTGGFGTSTFMSMGSLGYGAGDSAFLLSGDVPVELQQFAVD